MLRQVVSDTCSETCAVELPEMAIVLHTFIRFEILCQDIDIVISFCVEYMGSSCVIAGFKHCHEIQVVFCNIFPPVEVSKRIHLSNSECIGLWSVCSLT